MALRTKYFLVMVVTAVTLVGSLANFQTVGLLKEHPLIPVDITIEADGEVTLVIEDANGKRIRNLISQTFLHKGKNRIWWDGTDDLSRDLDAYEHGLYSVPARLVQPGTYTVRGLWHRPLELRYQMTFYSPGTPPWPTADGTGGWMTNHTPATSVAFVYADKSPLKQPLIYLGSWVSEGGSALSWVDLNGIKKGGRGWIGGNWTGAQYLAVDNGPSADSSTYLYVASVARDGSDVNVRPEIRLTKLTSKGDQPTLKSTFRFDFPYNNDRLPDTIGGLAVRDKLLVFSQTALNRIVFVDVKQNAVVGYTSVPNPRGLAFTNDGRLLVLSGTSLLSFSVAVNPAALFNAKTLVSELQDPHGITVNPSGHIFVSDQGKSNQVKAYSEDGRLIKVFGQAGPLQTGTYNPLHMNHPKGLAVDSNGRLWVTEDEFRPKRVSVWNPDGTLENAFYGPARYGGGGVLDFNGQQSRFLYDGMEFYVNLAKREQYLTRVYYRPGADSLPDSSVPEDPIAFGAHRYLANTFQSPTNGANVLFLFLDTGETAIPVAGIGIAQEWPLLQQPPFRQLWPHGVLPEDSVWGHPAFFLWSDLNGNGKPDPEEVVIRSGLIYGVTTDESGAFVISHFSPRPSGSGTAVRLQPVKIIGAGVPLYDLTKAEVLAPSQTSASDGGNQVLIGSNGWTVQTTPPPPFSQYGIGGSKDAVANWSYPSLWPSLHLSHTSPPPDRPGELIGTTRLLGPLIDNAGVGKLFFLNGNHGNAYVFTQDGLFVSQLFQDFRQGQPWQMPKEQPDALLNSLTLNGENFFPSVTQAPDGTVYLMAGSIAAVVRVDGLTTLQPIPSFQLQLSASDLSRCQEVLSQTQTQPVPSAKLLNVYSLPNPPALDGDPKHLAPADWASIDTRGSSAYFNAQTKPYNAKGTLVISGSNLIAAWETDEPRLLENSGTDIDSLFHSGGGLDLMLQTDQNAPLDRSAPADGDIRLFITRVHGQTRAAIYRQVAPGKINGEKPVFRSPWMSVIFDAVQDVSNQVKLLSDDHGGFEVSIPLSVLDFRPQPGTRVKGDIGILRGSGGQTMQRVYWANKATAIISDIPSEAALTPRMWGTLEIASHIN